jgi:hypothetical protein
MTDQREQTELGDEPNRIISELYHEITEERTPQHLNETVLREAAQAAQTPYARAIRWIRPVAWSATVALCLAITLQVSRMPETLPISFPMSPVAEPLTHSGGDDTLGGEDRPSPATDFPDSAANIAVSARKNERTVSPAAGDTRHVLPTGDVAASDNVAAAKIVTAEHEQAQQLQRAERSNRLRGEGLSEPTQATAASASSETDVAPACDDNARSSPETWLECIELLDKAGFVESAQKQRELRADAFPDNGMP